ncbi:midasin [Pancytospora philotis]|nr:midasin [Pancytospora philotis]
MTDISTLAYPGEITSRLRDMAEIDSVCVVYGEAGKTVLIQSLFPDVLVYDSREILEPKNLGGLYVVKDGTVGYVDGLLVRAMRAGMPLCFKRIDQAVALLQYLRPVLRERRITATDGTVVSAAPGFRLLFTAAAQFPLRNACFVGPVQFSRSAVMGSFGDMEAAVARVFTYLEEHKGARCAADRGLPCSGVCLKHEEDCACGDHMCARHFRMLCDLRHFLGMLKEDGPIDGSNANRCVLYQAFANIVLKHDAKQLSEFLYAVLPPLSLPNMRLAKTEPVACTLRGLISNIRCRRPTLLVGETGAGKTALVQYLSENSEYFFGRRKALKIVNMSSDFDGMALIGGYQSVDFDARIRELHVLLGMEAAASASRRAQFSRIVEQCDARLPSASRDEATVLARAKSEAEGLLRLLGGKLAFVHREGVLLQAMRSGTWLLLDEVNLAPRETLDLLEALLSGRGITVYESGSDTPVPVHEDFMVFACMNPFGDYGKKQYESAVFNRLVFYDFSASLKCIKAVVQSLSRNMLDDSDAIAEFYYEFKRMLVQRQLSNIVEPLVSGRTLCRAVMLIIQLRAEKDAAAAYHAFNLLFFTQLDFSSRAQAVALFKRFFKAAAPQLGAHAQEQLSPDFIVTPKVKIHLDDVDLAVRSRLPVLLQGDTSTGKTSLVYALAKKYGRRVLRVNNHEHTDAADYIGSYASAEHGFVFREGVLLTAMRRGHWLILDELNLAPSDVLEVLNRLLDDNRELYVPELDEVVRPHTNFRIFATQNISYGGRRGLAKSFRNRFVEIFFSEKDEGELQMILEKRCMLPAGFTKLIMQVYSALRVVRTINSIITLRDLFKWAKRGPRSYYEVYEIGLDILRDAQRTAQDRDLIQSTFDAVFKERAAADHKDYARIYSSRYASLAHSAGPCAADAYRDEYSSCYIFNSITPERFSAVAHGMIITRSYLRLIDAVYRAWLSREPVLLVGETGIGKTKICEIVAELFRIELRSINMHSGTECSDFVGCFELDRGAIQWRDGVLVRAMRGGNALLIDEINLAEDAVLERMNSVLEDERMLYVTETSCDVRAADGFRVVATMNPGGDYGKRELSPALRNRFTEIYFSLEDDEYHEIFDHMMRSAAIPEGDAAYYLGRYRELAGELSIRKIETIVAHLKNMYSVASAEQTSAPGICVVDPISDRAALWDDVLELLGRDVAEDFRYTANNERFGVAPFFLRTDAASPAAPVPFLYSARTVARNLQRIIRGLTLGKGLLLEGEPGVGKTTIVQSIARALGIPVLRINLSEHTEMSDLVGAYLPVGSTIRFVESEMVEHIRKGYWVILDEINLCTQSVIEGLNSLLDYRRMLIVNDEPVPVHESTRIFGTMNPVNALNGRKQLPKSFLDRFVIVKMAEYSAQDVREILSARYGAGYAYDGAESLRGNIKRNELALAGRGAASVPSGPSTAYAVADSLCVGGVSVPYASVDESYVFLHSQIPQIELLLRCLKMRLPVVLVGEIGCTPLLSFLAGALGLKVCTVDLHSETDTCDLLGQYCKAEGGEMLFEWRDSHLLDALREESLVVFNTPELVEKSVFDRLSPLFESERFLSVYEKGRDARVVVNESCRMVLRCDSPCLLSPALLDRCVIVSLSSSMSYVDAWKLFNRLPRVSHEGEHCTKKFRGPGRERAFRELARTNRLFDASDLDYLMRKHQHSGTVPADLDVVLPLTNALQQQRIDELFRVELMPEVEFDRASLAQYRYVSGFAVPLAHTLEERIANLKKSTQLNVFLKSIEYADDIHCSVPCSTAPGGVKQLKEAFIRSLRDKKLRDLPDIISFTDSIIGVGEVVECGATPAYDFPSEDPLLLVKREIESARASEHNRILSQIAQKAMDIYKYGDAGFAAAQQSPYEELKALHGEYDSAMEHFANLLIAVDRKLGRDYPKFLEAAGSATFCSYFRDPQLRDFMEAFSDVFDYRLMALFRARGECGNCRQCTSGLSSKDLCLRLLRSGEYTKSTSYSYSKYLYEACTGAVPSSAMLIFEALCFETPVDAERCESAGWRQLEHAHRSAEMPSEFTAAEIDECLRQMVPARTTAQVIETREQRILIGRDHRICPEIADESLFSAPEGLIEKLQSCKVSAESTLAASLAENCCVGDGAAPSTDSVTPEKALDWLTALYKKEKCLTVERNYRYYSYMLFNPPALASMEAFLMGSAMFEYVDRIHFAQRYLDGCYSDLLYNIILRYKAFELEELHARKTKECKAKLFKEPRLYESTIHTYVDRLLYIPVTSLLDIKFDRPICQGTHEAGGPAFLLNGFDPNGKGPCECNAWVALALKHNKRQLVALLSGYPLVSRETVTQRFYHRRPAVQFSSAEIALAKVFSVVMDNINKQYYDEAAASCMLWLLNSAVDYPFVPFLFFIFKLSDMAETKVEDGVALKSGEGENTIEDKIKEEDICDDVDMGENNNADSDGIDMDNEGELQSAEGESEADESGVDDASNSGEKEKEDFEERGAVEEIDALNEVEKEDDAKPEESSSTADAEDGGEEEVSEAASSADEEREASEDGSAGASEDAEEASAADGGESQHDSSENENIGNYQWTEASLNREQTCDNADGYDRKVAGGCIEEQDALEEGEGNEAVEGEGEAGEGVALQRRVAFPDGSGECARLVELLRVALASNKNSKYKGDYKSGKKLNLKKIIPYIASDYRKDRIWMKRLKADKKEYTIRLFIDNSKSMYNQELVDLLAAVYYKLSAAFSVLGIPVELYRFGESLHACRISEMTFTDDSTSVAWIDDYTDGINIILTDGIFQAAGGRKDNFLVLMIDRGNIRKMSKVAVYESRVFVERYLDTFALPYCIVDSVAELEHAFIESLKNMLSNLM